MNGVGDQRQNEFLHHFVANEAAIHAYVRSLVPTRDDAREVMQEVAQVLWRKFEGADSEEDFRKWAFGVARFKILARARDLGRERLIFDEDLLETLAEESRHLNDYQEAQREALEGCLQALPEPQRELVLSAYEPGARADRLAEQRGQTAMAIYKMLHRVRMALIQCTQRVLAREELS